MPPPPSDSPDEDDGRLQRCIRDLAALNALPSMCIGRSPGQAMDIGLEALPTALSCNLVYLAVPGASPEQRAMLRGNRVPDEDAAGLGAALLAEPFVHDAREIAGVGKMWCLGAEVPLSFAPGRLVAARG